MTDDKHVVRSQGVRNAERIEPTQELGLGQWYWLVSDKKRSKIDPIASPDGAPRLMCVTNIGSNFVELTAPRSRNHSSGVRLHFNEFFEMLIPERDAQSIISENIRHHRGRASRLLNHIQKVTSQLGLTSQGAITHSEPSSSTSLAALSGAKDITKYQKSLKLAKTKILPKLFAKLKLENQILESWISAESLELEASMSTLEGTLGAVQERLFNVSLYAGLSEESVKVRDGATADYHEKIHLFQQMKFMDEECLVNYSAGGMEFTDITHFDAWLADPENFHRLLPFSKCVCLFQVRRNIKERRASTLMDAFINVRLAQQDQNTFLYVRNGEQLYRLTIYDFEFGAKLFPDSGSDNLDEPMMVKMFAGSVDRIISKREFDADFKEWSTNRRLSDKWIEENPFDEWKKLKFEAGLARLNEAKEDIGVTEYGRRLEKLQDRLEDENKFLWRGENPYANRERFNPNDWTPLTPENIYYDEALAKVNAETKQFNAMALILQGLLDRSEVFHPHPPVKTWEPDGFTSIFELVYDGSAVIHSGEKPDIEAYIAGCNELIDTNSVLYGQQKAWMRREAEKENARRARDYSGQYQNTAELEYFSPYGNPGPQKLSKPERLSRDKTKALFVWERDLVGLDRYGETRRATFNAPVSELFNVSAYKPGDYKKFYTDSRTRMEYLKWAPMLLTAEDYHAGREI